MFVLNRFIIHWLSLSVCTVILTTILTYAVLSWTILTSTVCHAALWKVVKRFLTRHFDMQSRLACTILIRTFVSCTVLTCTYEDGACAIAILTCTSTFMSRSVLSCPVLKTINCFDIRLDPVPLLHWYSLQVYRLQHGELVPRRWVSWEGWRRGTRTGSSGYPSYSTGSLLSSR